MRILIVTDGFPPESYGGAETQAYNSALALMGDGHEVVVFSCTQDAKQQGWTVYENIPVFHFHSKYHPRWRAYKSLYNRDVVWRFWEELRRVGPDIVHFHNIHTHFSYYTLKLAQKEPNTKVYITLHDVMSFHYGKFVEYINPKEKKCIEHPKYTVTPWMLIKRFKRWYNPIRNICIRHYLRYAHRRFAVSNELKKALEANGIKGVEVAYNTIDLHDWNIDQKVVDSFKKKHRFTGTPLILFGGRVSTWKGSQEIIDIIQEVIRKIPDAKLIMMGERNKAVEQALERAESCGIADHIYTTGYLSGDELRAAYHASDIVVMPSVCFDTFGMACLEAMACKKPVVTTCFGGSKEVVEHGVTGYVANPYDTETYAKYIVELLTDTKKAHQYGERGYDRAQTLFSSPSQSFEQYHTKGECSFSKTN